MNIVMLISYIYNKSNQDYSHHTGGRILVGLIRGLVWSHS